MVLRVTDEEVRGIIDTAVTDTVPFITAADLIVTAKLSSSGLSDEHLKEITKWLAAHFIAIRDPRAAEEKIGDATVRYALGSNVYSNAGKDLSGLNATPYGQQVLLLDTSGLLATTLSKKIANIEAMGPESDE